MPTPTPIPVWIPILAALLGAVAAGLFQAVSGVLERRRRRRATLVALVSEVDAVREMILHEGYETALAEILKEASSGNWDGASYISDIRSDHFTVFNSLAPALGDLGSNQARDIVRFYSLCKYASDAVRPTSPLHTLESREKLEELTRLHVLFVRILELGSRISAYISEERFLTHGERQLAASVFGSAVDYGKVRVKHKKYFPFQSNKAIIAPDGHLYVDPRANFWSDDYSKEAPWKQGLLIHQLTHVWQTQHRGKWYLLLMRHPFCRFSYSLRPGWPLERYGLEQQAEILRHAFMRKHAYPLDDSVPSWQELEPVVRSLTSPEG